MSRWALNWQVWVDGLDMSSRMNPYLIQIEVSDRDEVVSNIANITLDDANAQLPMPRIRSTMRIVLEGLVVFEGWVDEIRSTGARNGGRIMIVGGKGFDALGKVKQPQDFHLDHGTVQQFLDMAARPAGISQVVIDPVYAGITRDYWASDNESFLHLLQRVANELGATGKIYGTRAGLAQKGMGINALGVRMPTITGYWGDNLIFWDIAPQLGRPRHSLARVRWYDRPGAIWREEDVDIELPPDSKIIPTYSQHDADTSRHHARSKRSKSHDDKGEGTARIELAPDARVEGTFIMSGARPGVDGPYRISGVVHRCDRGGGSVTSLALKHPGPPDDTRPSTPAATGTATSTGGGGAIITPENPPASPPDTGEVIGGP